MPRPFSVVAIIAAHNEADIIEYAVRDLIEQGVDVYYIDDDSTDGTREIVERYVGRGVLAVERFDGAPGRFEWERILRRKEELAATLDADWFIHHDADEFRESPWAGVRLANGIRMADEVGCNAIDFNLYNFQPDHDGFISGTDVRTSFGFYEPPAPYDRLQIRCWRKGDHPVDLASSGGHEARFDGRRVFPIRFVLRHYPIRGQVHGVRKVISERRARFNLDERERGWHVQYEGIDGQTSFIRPQAGLIPFNAVESRRALPIATAAVMDFERTIGELRAELRTAEDATLRAEDRAAERQAALQAQLDSTSTKLEARTAARDALAARVLILEQAAAQHAQEIAALQATIADRDLAVEHYRTRALAFEQSLSWRWTAPARAAARLVTGR